MPRASCLQCSAELRTANDVCPSCGSDPRLTAEASSPVEAPGRLLDFRPGQSFAERFTIIERIGEGGMGVVYKAIDTELDCTVVLKLIRPEYANNPRYVSRFRREVRVTRQITHPNICRIHDIGSSRGVLFLSMEWIEGESLSELLRKTGTLREGRALEVARMIALGLVAAHEHGIIHRDLKPSNVMVGRHGNVYILDFGLAQERDAEELTGKGALLGTPTYMAPEQRRRTRVDARADLYSLGAILYEMLTGQRVSPESTRAFEPTAVNSLIRPLLERVLAESPEKRFPSALAVRQALDELLESSAFSGDTSSLPGSGVRHRVTGTGARWIVATVALIGVAAIAAWFVLSRDRSEPVPPINVYYERGMYYLREESETTRGLDDAIQMFNRALDADSQSALTWARLAETYWARFDRTREPASRREAERALQHALEIDPELPEVLNARGFGLLIEGKLAAAREELDRAIEARPRFAMAWANLAEVHRRNGDYAEGLRAVRRSIELDPESFKMQVYAGLFHMHFQEYAAASDYFRRAMDLKPNSITAYTNLGAALLHAGKYEEAIPAFERSIELHDNPTARSNLGTALYFLGDYEGAVEHYRQAIELDPGYPVHHGNLGDAYLALGRDADYREAYTEAARVASKRLALEPLSPQAMMDLAVYCAKAGDGDCALRHGAEAVEQQPEHAGHLVRFAAIHVLLGRNDTALDWLEKAVRLGASRAEIDIEPDLSPLANDPRFEAIVSLAS